MSQSQQNKYWLRSVVPIFAGLACTQLIATLFVWQSNHHIFAQTKALTAAGWFAIPTGPAALGLKAFRSAIFGGLFYTLSAGAGLTLATWGIMILRHRFFPENRNGKFVAALIWIGLVVVMNLNGPTLFPSLFVLCVPALTAWLTHQGIRGEGSGSHHWLGSLPLMVLVFLTALWATQLNADLFITIRDHILLSNPLGRSVNSFYYRNTLYAAEAIKSIEQMAIKTCRLENIQNPEEQRRITRVVAAHNLLVVTEFGPVDLIIHQLQQEFVITSPSGGAVRIEQTKLIKAPQDWIQSISDISDRNKIFRRLIFAGLLIGFPCLLYMSVYGIIKCLVIFLARNEKAVLISSGICLVIGIGLFIQMMGGRSPKIEENQISDLLQASSWPQRVSALRYIEKQSLEIARFPQYQKLLESSLEVERYWLARALAVSRSRETYNDLLKLINDPDPNVICQSYYALGERGNPSAIQHIKANMMSSDHWYTQWYGYRAIRKLGWNQKQSKPTP